jgi:hypothetical protein
MRVLFDGMKEASSVPARAETEDDSASVRLKETGKHRTPHPHDVLFGLGGGLGRTYHHAGNVQFRKWVSEHKTSYLLATNNEERTHTFRGVIALA